MIKISKEKKGDNMLKKCSAVVSMVFNAAGLYAPSQGHALKAIKKEMNMAKGGKKRRRGTGLEDIMVIIRDIYRKGNVSATGGGF